MTEVSSIRMRRAQKFFRRKRSRKKKTTKDDVTEDIEPPDCPTLRHCELRMSDTAAIRSQLHAFAFDRGVDVIDVRLDFVAENYSEVSHVFRLNEWSWAKHETGKTLLALPLDADLLSLGLIARRRRLVTIHVTSQPHRCFLKLEPLCRLRLAEEFVVGNVTRRATHEDIGPFVCHKSYESDKLQVKCCDSSLYTNHNEACQHVTPRRPRIVTVTSALLVLVAVVVTLYSPLFILRIKMLLSFDSTTKFFRASLRHEQVRHVQSTQPETSTRLSYRFRRHNT